MKLKFITSLNEADADRGKRILKLREINDSIKSAVESAGYKFKDQSDKGFYIIPKFEHVARIEIDLLETENAYNVTIYDALDKDQPGLAKKIPGNEFRKTFKETIVPSALNLLFRITPEDIDRLKKGVSEALPKFLQGVITNIKDKVDNVKTFFDTKAAEKVDKKNIDNLKKECEAAVNELVDEMPGRSRKIVVKATSGGTHIDILLNSDIIAGVIYALDSAGTDKRFIVTGCITSVAENKGIDCSLASFISFLNRKLGLQIKIKDASMLTFTGSDSAEVTKVNSFEVDLKDTLGDEILTKIGEALRLTEDAIKPDNVNKYDDALKVVKNDTQGQALVKLYFYRESGKKIQLTDYQARDLYNIIKDVGSFAKEKSPILNIFINYYNLHQSSASIQDELKNLLTILIDDDFGNKLGKIGRDSLILNKAFIMNPEATSVTRDIYNKYTNIIDYGVNVIDADTIAKIKGSVPGIIIPKAEELNNNQAVANFVIFTDFKNKATIRNIKDIETLYNILYSGRAKTSKTSAKVTSTPAKDEPVVKGLDKEQVKNIKAIFDLKNLEGTQAVDYLINQLKDPRPENQAVRKLLTQILNQVQ